VARDVDLIIHEAFNLRKADGPALQLEKVEDLAIKNSTPLKDVTLPTVAKTSF
jgi:hypothetical protein